MHANKPLPLPHRSRVILLGASNLSSAISTIIRIIQFQLPAPIDFHLAAGFGRSYGQTSTVLTRTLPGILQSELWPTITKLSTQKPLPTYALITDIGNDLGYSVPLPTLKSWIEKTIQNLQALSAKTIITSLPLHSINRLSETHYKIARNILFASNTTTLTQMQSQMAEINTTIQTLSEIYQLPLIKTQLHQYGLDPIHIKKKHWQSHWQKALQNWQPEIAHPPQPPKLKNNPTLFAYLWTRWPKHRTILNTPHHRAQPSGKLKDHSTFSVY